MGNVSLLIGISFSYFIGSSNVFFSSRKLPLSHKTRVPDEYRFLCKDTVTNTIYD